MLFNSLDFAIFLPIVFAAYWLLGSDRIKLQNILIVIASYVFYGWWDWRFLSLILFSTIVDFFIGSALFKTENPRKRKHLLWTSLSVNLGLLGVFKYYNFFVENFVEAFTFFGGSIQPNTLDIILPVGISFYTFQTLSYTIDVYRKKLTPTNDFINFTAFVSFFPQLVAGPIERASNLLPQFSKKRTVDYSHLSKGFGQIIWGLFKKVVIADNFAVYANQIFENSENYSGFVLLLGAFFFAFQIYGDFSGYSDIAIGTARLFGFNLMQNFATPYFSRDIAEFWRRWHISLSTWFRDYLYIPLGGSRGSQSKVVRNTFIIFLVSGFWHGANWTFIAWGAINAIYFLPLLLTKVNRSNVDVVAERRWYPTPKEVLQMALTFFLTLIAWVFFRATDMSHAWQYLGDLFSGMVNGQSIKAFGTYFSLFDRSLWIIFLGFLLIEWLGRRKHYSLEIIERTPVFVRILCLILISMVILLFMSTGEQDFIYFQF